MAVISIPNFEESGGTIHYNIHVRLPLRSISCSRRYSDFVALVNAMCASLGIAKSDFPYSLPPKGRVFASKHKIASERKESLARFLELLIKDREVQNSKLLHDFLKLPPNFKFTPDLFSDDSNGVDTDDKFLIAGSAKDIGKNEWLTHFRQVRSTVENLRDNSSLSNKVSNRDRIAKYIRPNIEKLVESLQHLSDIRSISTSELKSRTSSLSALQAKLDSTIGVNNSPTTPTNDVRKSRWVFSSPDDEPSETASTRPLTNRELLQQQQQIHVSQDKELEELRKIIAKQKQIGETINREVEEQSELLDALSEEVEASSGKLQGARGRVRKIG